ncbi:hypothetical protein JCM10213_004174 [Rhodosporidiobolus nylandii]
MLLGRAPHLARPLHQLPTLPRTSPSFGRMNSTSAIPTYLLHAPFLSIHRPHLPDYPSQLLQRTLPPSPLYYIHPAPSNPPGTAPPALNLLDVPPVQGQNSTVYRAQSPSGANVVLKWSMDFLALMREAEEVYVNLPAGTGLPIPIFWGIFEGKVEKDQPKALCMVLEDCGQPLQGGFEALTREERQKLYNSLEAFHSIHFQHGAFSPSSIVTRTSSSAAPASSETSAPSRKVTLTGFSKAEWHLCPGPDSCKELVEAKKALGLDGEATQAS